jgi:subtilisin-like proprotein convertase family protein
MTKQALVALVVLALSASPAHATDFSGGTITIPDVGAASPYPSEITVSGATRAVGRVAVRLRLTHDSPEDIDVMLVGPGGQAVMLMSDVGGAPLSASTTVTFADEATAPLPDPIVGGTFRPTNVDDGDGDAFTAPAPAGAPGAALSVFKGTNPNGVWRLWVIDDAALDSGQISSWTLTIDDAPRSPAAWSAASAVVPEPSGAANVTFTRTGGALPATVDYASRDVFAGAVAGRDYTAVSGTLAFAAGQTSATIAVPILDNVRDGPNRQFRIHAQNATGDASLGGSSLDTFVTIADDDPTPSVSIADLRLPENGVASFGAVVISLSAPSDFSVTANLTFKDVTTTPSDHNGVAPGFSIPPGTASVTLPVRARHDNMVEGNETFTAALSDVAFATLGRSTATVTIVDDDKPAPPELPGWHLSKRGTLELAVTSNFDGIAVARVRIGRNVLRSGQLRVLAGRPATVKVPLPSTLRGALKRHRRLTARVAVTVSDGSVHVSGRRTFRIHA